MPKNQFSWPLGFSWHRQLHLVSMIQDFSVKLRLVSNWNPASASQVLSFHTRTALSSTTSFRFARTSRKEMCDVSCTLFQQPQGSNIYPSTSSAPLGPSFSGSSVCLKTISKALLFQPQFKGMKGTACFCALVLKNREGWVGWRGEYEYKELKSTSYYLKHLGWTLVKVNSPQLLWLHNCCSIFFLSGTNISVFLFGKRNGALLWLYSHTRPIIFSSCFVRATWIPAFPTSST